MTSRIDRNNILWYL